MTPETVPLTLRRNVPFVEEYLFTDDDGEPVDFTGYTGKLEVRLYGAQPGDAPISLETVTTNAAGVRFMSEPGVIRIRTTKTMNNSLPDAPERGKDAEFTYDLVLTPPTGDAAVWMEGKVIVKPGVTV